MIGTVLPHLNNGLAYRIVSVVLSQYYDVCPYDHCTYVRPYAYATLKKSIY